MVYVIIGVLVVVTIFLGLAALRLYLDRSYDGAIVVSPKEGGGTLFTLEVGINPDDIPKQKSIRLEVKHEDAD